MAAPTFPTAADLVGGTGTRSFAAVTTTAGDYLVVQVIAELDTTTASGMTPSDGALTYTSQNDTGTSASNDHTRVFQWTAPDAAGASRTVTITPADGTTRYRARVTVVRGSGGPGTGKAVSRTAQVVSVARQGANSGMFMAVGDWDAGAVGSPVWTPGGTTVASQQQAGAATYIFGRWDDSGATGTASHGISSPTYGTPSIAVLEMLGTAGGSTLTISGVAASTTSATGAITATLTISGTAASVSSATGAITALLPIAGTAASTSAATGALTRVTPIAGSGASTTSATGDVTITTGAITWSIGGAAASTTTATGAVVLRGALTGAAASTTSATGALTLQAVISATAATSTSATGALGIRYGIGGIAASITAAAGDVTISVVGTIVIRPNTGTTARPATGTITRPNTGIVTRP